MMPITDGAVVPAETIAEAVAWYRDVRAMAPDANVVIHCYAGASRSATVGYAILRACYGVGHLAARLRVRTRNGIIAYPSDRVMADAARWCNEERLSVRR
jgi:protein-tyrosine phosphatase